MLPDEPPAVSPGRRAAPRAAGDLARLAELRRGLRERMRHSPLMDASRLTRHVEAICRDLWDRWAAR